MPRFDYPDVERVLYRLGGSVDARPAQPGRPRDAASSRPAPSSRIPNEGVIAERLDMHFAVQRLTLEDRQVIDDTYIAGRFRHPYASRNRAVRALQIELTRLLDDPT